MSPPWPFRHRLAPAGPSVRTRLVAAPLGAAVMPIERQAHAGVSELQLRPSTPSDRDGDGIADDVDGDDDHDLVTDRDEPAGDTGGDGVPDPHDPDSDHDGPSDLREAGGGIAESSRPADVSLPVLAAGAGRMRRRAPVGATAAMAGAATLLLGACTTFEPPSRALDVESLHVGLGIGASRLDADTDGTTLTADDSGSTSVQLTLGATLAPWLDVEIRAVELGEQSFVGGGTAGYRVIDAGAVLRRERGSATWFARAGLGALFNYGDVQVHRRNPVHLALGGGLDVPVAGRWRIRLEASGHDVDAAHAGVALVRRFDPAPRPAMPTRRIDPLANGPGTHGNASPDAGSSETPSGELLIEPLANRARPVPPGVSRGETRRDRVPPDILPIPRSRVVVPEAAPPVPPPDVALAPRPPSGERGGVGESSPAFDAGDYDIRFDHGSDRLTSASRRSILSLARALEASPETELAIVTSVGPREALRSDFLSRRRALAVVRALGTAGVDVTRLRPELRPSSGDADDDRRAWLIERDASGD